MGTAYKGDTKFYRSIGQNIMIASNSYAYHEGYFGSPSPNGNSSIRNISSSDNLKTATDFYDKIALGGTEIVKDGGNVKITTMADGTIITMRTSSHSDGTPAVDINIKYSQRHASVKKQKIHFIMEADS